MTSVRQWWRRAAAVAKDKRCLYMTRMAGLRPRGSGVVAALRNPELEAAVIRATSHDERSVDYKNAARVFAWARASPLFLQPLMWALARRAGRTRCWAVALKVLMLAHGLLLRSELAPPTARLGRLPFDLADFRDGSSSPSTSSGFSAFVRAYFLFLDSRSLFAAQEIDTSLNNGTDKDTVDDNDDDTNDDVLLDQILKMQTLLELLMQIRPYGDGMELVLILEAMDCVVIEIFEVYSKICNGIARFLVGILGSAPTSSKPRPGETAAEARRRRGLVGMKVLRKAAEQSTQLSAYFELCRGLGVLNAAEFPAVERVPEDDIRDLEKLITSHADNSVVTAAVIEEEEEALVVADDTSLSKTVVTREWVVFDDDNAGTGNGADCERKGHFGNSFVPAPWAVRGSGNLFELEMV